MLNVTIRLPELQDELQKLLQQTEDALRQLPKPPSDDVVAETLHLLNDFTRDLDVCLEGTPKSDGLIQSIRPHEITFKKAIRSTAPNFKPVKRPLMNKDTFPSQDEGGSDDGSASFAFLGNEEDSTLVKTSNKEPIYIDQVMQRVNQ